ncbi:small GTP-binding protein, putative [Trichomonas vaginalis G3]|uniref:Small GTP-binding protein, putative n=1 Tax=Trichomonas vaginalis (strain ATCC PRA-98 / G3) TaxID=412133 RepID=A2EPF4_TRIV3|nr:GTPase protein [Trichomonas vaginalis G3]EAY05462.1 small GTP-binding protein, putative [Trichomonas vaginalis G3]KAI5503560.1 GTPase protein [Trichomonas vaginalis G3]|eukprot:XP_001317685.1 small GTP-binding protein [Trichomonas vaginalis G3]
MNKVKIVLVGSAHTGKTSIINRYIYGGFTPHTMPSTQPGFFQKKVQNGEGEIQVEIWDTAGQEQYHALSPMFYRDADGGIVVFDLTDSSSFAKSKQWINEIRAARGDDCTIFLVGNKSDLQSIRTVTLETMQNFAKSINVSVYETSAKTGENIELLFNSVVKQISKSAKLNANFNTQRMRSTVRFTQPAEEKSVKCCK